MEGLALVFWSAFSWRMRGVYGWPFTILWAWPFAAYFGHGWDKWTLPILLVSHIGETVGWKPKAARAGRWWECAWRGAFIWGVGAILVPLSTWLHMRFGEPSWPRSNFTHFTGTIARRPLDWFYAWNEVYFGALFGLVAVTLGGVLW